MDFSKELSLSRTDVGVVKKNNQTLGTINSVHPSVPFGENFLRPSVLLFHDGTGGFSSPCF